MVRAEDDAVAGKDAVRGDVGEAAFLARRIDHDGRRAVRDDEGVGHAVLDAGRGDIVAESPEGVVIGKLRIDMFAKGFLCALRERHHAVFADRISFFEILHRNGNRTARSIRGNGFPEAHRLRNRGDAVFQQEVVDACVCVDFTHGVFFSGLFRFQEVLDILRVFTVWFSNLFQSYQVID